MLINVVLHISSNNQFTKYTMNCSELFKVNHEKDLGVTISNDLKPDKHCSDVKKNKRTNWSASSVELLSINLKKLSLHYIRHSYILI